MLFLEGEVAKVPRERMKVSITFCILMFSIPFNRKTPTPQAFMERLLCARCCASEGPETKRKTAKGTQVLYEPLAPTEAGVRGLIYSRRVTRRKEGPSGLRT